jgi:hypothetical protein
MSEAQIKSHSFKAGRHKFTNSAITRSFEMIHGDRVVAIGKDCRLVLII